MSLQDRIMNAKARSDKELDLLLTEPPSYESVYRHLRVFITNRFLIDDGFWNDSLSSLASHSIELIAKKSPDGESIKDLSMHCTGASSSETKRALLFITLRKQLDLNITPSMTVTHDSVSLLAKEIASQLTAKQKPHLPEGWRTSAAKRET